MNIAMAGENTIEAKSFTTQNFPEFRKSETPNEKQRDKKKMY